VAEHGKGKIPKATCMLWHMRIPRGNHTGNISNNNARPAKPDKDKYLIRLEAEYRAEELKARIRAAKMMSQGITYSQMVEGPPSRSSTGPRHTARRPDCSHSGRGDCHTRGYRRAAETTTSAVDLKNGIKTSLRPQGRPGRREKGIPHVMKRKSRPTSSETSNGEDNAKGVVNGGVVEVSKVVEVGEVCEVKVGEVEVSGVIISEVGKASNAI
jgi:hypothetical protein